MKRRTVARIHRINRARDSSHDEPAGCWKRHAAWSRSAIKALREQGILVALDDFGTGFASPTHLLSFPVGIIKIDKSFVQHLDGDEPAGVVVGAVLDIARQLRMRVVAEGIETSEQMQILRDRGCQLGQGYHFSRPISARDTTDLLRVMAQGTRHLQSPATEKRYA